MDKPRICPQHQKKEHVKPTTYMQVLLAFIFITCMLLSTFLPFWPQEHTPAQADRIEMLNLFSENNLQ